MALSLTVNGVTYQYPQTGNENWGDPASNWAQAITNAYLPKAGGSFTLTGELDFGAFFGLRQLYLRSETTNPAAAGVVRLAKTDSVSWRNNANGADLALAINGSDLLTFGGTVVPLSGSIVNADINASAAIAYSKLALSGSILNADINSSAAIAYSKLALTGSILNADVNASAAIAYSKLALTGAILNADINASAAIAYSKLALTGAVVNADISTSAAIAYSKLALTGSVVNADIGASAAIAYSKLAALSTAKALQSNSSTGFIEASSVTNTELGFVSGVTSAIQTQINNVYLPTSYSDAHATALGFKTYDSATAYNGSITPAVTSSVSGWTTSAANFQPWQDQAGNWFMRIQIQGAYTGNSHQTANLTIAGVTFANQGVNGWALSFVQGNNNTTSTIYAYAARNGTFCQYFLSAAVSGLTLGITGWAQLASKPTWAY